MINNGLEIIGGDIIIAIDNNRIISGDALMSYLEEYTKPNETISITILRDNNIIDVPVVLGFRPALI